MNIIRKVKELFDKEYTLKVMVIENGKKTFKDRTFKGHGLSRRELIDGKWVRTPIRHSYRKNNGKKP